MKAPVFKKYSEPFFCQNLTLFFLQKNLNINSEGMFLGNNTIWYALYSNFSPKEFNFFSRTTQISTAKLL